MLEGCQDFTGNGASSRVSEAVAVFVLMNLVTAIIAGSRVGFVKKDFGFQDGSDIASLSSASPLSSCAGEMRS